MCRLAAVADLPQRGRCGARHAAPEPELALSLEAYERCAIERALEASRGDATAAARLLGIGRSTLYRKIAKHGLKISRR